MRHPLLRDRRERRAGMRKCCRTPVKVVLCRHWVRESSKFKRGEVRIGGAFGRMRSGCWAGAGTPSAAKTRHLPRRAGEDLSGFGSVAPASLLGAPPVRRDRGVETDRCALAGGLDCHRDRSLIGRSAVPSQRRSVRPPPQAEGLPIRSRGVSRVIERHPREAHARVEAAVRAAA